MTSMRGESFGFALRSAARDALASRCGSGSSRFQREWQQTAAQRRSALAAGPAVARSRSSI